MYVLEEVDYNSLGINIIDNVGNISYNWTSNPPGTSWTGLSPHPYSYWIKLCDITVEDDASGCTDSEVINLSYQSTSANASFVSSLDTITCPGQSVTFTTTILIQVYIYILGRLMVY